MDKIDYLILDYLCDFTCKLSMLLAPERALAFNKDDIPCYATELLSRILRLNKRGFIFLDAFPSHIQLTTEYLLTHRKYIEIGLTATGGAFWERIFDADWTKFIEMYSDTIDETTESIIIEAANYDYLNQVIAEFGLPTPTQIKEQAPWQANYWKSLDTGYQYNATISTDKRLSLINTHTWKKHWQET